MLVLIKSEFNYSEQSEIVLGIKTQDMKLCVTAAILAYAGNFIMSMIYFLTNKLGRHGSILS